MHVLATLHEVNNSKMNSQSKIESRQLALFLYAVIACAKMLDTAAKKEDCRVACTMGGGAMISVGDTVFRFFITALSSILTSFCQNAVGE